MFYLNTSVPNGMNDDFSLTCFLLMFHLLLCYTSFTLLLHHVLAVWPGDAHYTCRPWSFRREVSVLNVHGV